MDTTRKIWTNISVNYIAKLNPIITWIMLCLVQWSLSRDQNKMRIFILLLFAFCSTEAKDRKENTAHQNIDGHCEVLFINLWWILGQMFCTEWIWINWFLKEAMSVFKPSFRKTKSKEKIIYRNLKKASLKKQYMKSIFINTNI